MTTRESEDKEFQEVIRLKNALVACTNEMDKERIQTELIEKIDRWFKIYRPLRKP